MGFSFHHESGLESFPVCYVTLFPAEPSTVASLGGVIHVSPIRQLRQGSCDLSEAEVGGSRAQNPLLGPRLRQNLPCLSLLYVSSVRRCLINTYCVPGDGVDVRLALLWQRCSGRGLQGQGGFHCQLCHASAESPGRQLSQPQFPH